MRGRGETLQTIVDPADRESLVAATYAALGRKRPSLAWAKIELFLGLAAVSVGLEMDGGDVVLRVVSGTLVTLGAYLALAGHRTHLYDAMTRQTALRAAREPRTTRARA